MFPRGAASPEHLLNAVYWSACQKHCSLYRSLAAFSMRQWQCSFPILLWATLKNDWSKLQLYCMLWNKTYAHNYMQNTGKQTCTRSAEIPTVHTYTCCISHSLRHSPASRLSPAVLLSMSRALEVEDLMWSLKDFCSSNSLIERDMPISIHRYRMVYS